MYTPVHPCLDACTFYSSSVPVTAYRFVFVCMCVCACVRACVDACVRACVCVCVFLTGTKPSQTRWK